MRHDGAWLASGWSRQAGAVPTWQVIARWIQAARRRRRQRRELLQLDERLLRDIGITRDDARAESLKRCWR